MSTSSTIRLPRRDPLAPRLHLFRGLKHAALSVALGQWPAGDRVWIEADAAALRAVVHRVAGALCCAPNAVASVRARRRGCGVRVHADRSSGGALGSRAPCGEACTEGPQAAWC